MSKLLNCLINRDISYKPVWFMRQAGRYLPEFRDIRLKNPDFLKLCLDSELASKITFQPLERYELDAAIIFSDILTIPYALGQQVVFNNPNGPKIDKFNTDKFFSTSKSEFLSKLEPVYNAIKLTRKKIGKEKSLIGFVGAPWTLLIYLLNLREGKEINKKRLLDNKKNLNSIIKKLIEFINYHIVSQIDAGADVIQIFDSWAGLLDEKDFEKYCFEPNKEIVQECRKKNIATICFPKGIGEKYKDFIKTVEPNGINIDYDIDPIWAKENLDKICIQGGMKPELLLKGDDLTLKEVDKYLNIFENNSYIFNLGHGILPQTNPETVKKIVDKIKYFNR